MKIAILMILTCFIGILASTIYHAQFECKQVVMIHSDTLHISIGKRIYGSFDGKYYFKIDTLRKDTAIVLPPNLYKTIEIK